MIPVNFIYLYREFLSVIDGRYLIDGVLDYLMSWHRIVGSTEDAKQTGINYFSGNHRYVTITGYEVGVCVRFTINGSHKTISEESIMKLLNSTIYIT